MTEQSFSLQPFPASGPPNPWKITGNIARPSPHTLAIRYVLLGHPAKLAIPAPADSPVRRNGLWEKTCFELFLAPRNSPLYWELNLSPAGHWNVYSFSGYRQGMREETGFTSLPFNVESRWDRLALELDLDLGRIVPAKQVLEVGISAVIKSTDGEASFWALTHPGPQPDFHRRDGFIIEL